MCHNRVHYYHSQNTLKRYTNTDTCVDTVYLYIKNSIERQFFFPFETKFVIPESWHHLPLSVLFLSPKLYHFRVREREHLR